LLAEVKLLKRSEDLGEEEKERNELQMRVPASEKCCDVST
jgi:hypothetical protein